MARYQLRMCRTGASHTSLPGTASASWTNPQNITTAANYAQVPGPSTLSRYLTAYNFNFRIPTAANVLGVVLQVSKNNADSIGTAPVVDYRVRLMQGVTPTGADRAVASQWSFTQTAMYYPVVPDPYIPILIDTWGVSLTPAAVNTSSFGAGIAASSSVRSSFDYGLPRVYWVKMRVYYSDVGTAGTHESGRGSTGSASVIGNVSNRVLYYNGAPIGGHVY